MLASCHKDPAVTTRAVTLHAPEGCAPGLADLDANAYSVYHALGDYEPAPQAGGHPSGAGIVLPEIDPAARVLVVDSTEQDRTWHGAAAIPPTGAVDVLLLPAATSCALRGPISARSSPAMAPVGGGRMLLVGGQGNQEFPPTLSVRLDTGAFEAVSPDLLVPRTRATVTAFGNGGLVAGGVDAHPGGSVLNEAEVYDPGLGGFDQQHPITLSTPRADAGSTVLVTGETLLVGGVGADGATALDAMEVVDPVTRTVRVEGVAQLAVPRRSPSVLRLASGEILVAGGTDTGGAPVTTLEWFAVDASRPSRPTQELVAGVARSYVALQAGGALAVVAPPTGADPSFQNVWVIGADGVIAPGAPLLGGLPQPVLLGGAGGAPVLWTGTGSDGTPGRWLQWQPWSGSFGALGVLDDAPAHVGQVTASPDPGLAMWLDTTDATSPRLTGLRFDVRGPYATLAGPLLVGDTTDVAPDRMVESGVVSFDPSVGLSLATGAGAFVTDRTYADFEVQVDAPTGAPAMVVLRDELGKELEVGGAGCPGALMATGTPSSLTIRRRGVSLSWSLSGGSSGTCASPFAVDARLSIGLRGSGASPQPSVGRNLRIARLGSP